MNPSEHVNLCTFFYITRLSNAQEVIFSNSIFKKFKKLKTQASFKLEFRGSF